MDDRPTVGWGQQVTVGRFSLMVAVMKLCKPWREKLTTKPITHRQAADLLTAWADRRIPAKPSTKGIDLSLQEACDDLCRWLADDPERNLSDVPDELLVQLRARILFAVGACMTQPDAIIGRVPHQTPDQHVLAGLLGVQLANTRFPAQWHPN